MKKISVLKLLCLALLLGRHSLGAPCAGELLGVVGWLRYAPAVTSVEFPTQAPWALLRVNSALDPHFRNPLKLDVETLQKHELPYAANQAVFAGSAELAVVLGESGLVALGPGFQPGSTPLFEIPAGNESVRLRYNAQGSQLLIERQSGSYFRHVQADVLNLSDWSSRCIYRGAAVCIMSPAAIGFDFAGAQPLVLIRDAHVQPGFLAAKDPLTGKGFFLQTHEANFRSMKMERQGRWLYGLADDGGVYAWDLAAGRPRGSLSNWLRAPLAPVRSQEGLPKAAFGLAASRHSSKAAVLSPEGVHFFHPETGKVSPIEVPPKAKVFEMFFGPGDQWLAGHAHLDFVDQIGIWNGQTGAFVGWVPLPLLSQLRPTRTSLEEEVAISSDNRRLVVLVQDFNSEYDRAVVWELPAI